jgi:hypothetical protein
MSPEMDLNEIRVIVASSTARDWHILRNLWPGDFIEPPFDPERLELLQHSHLRAVLLRDLDVALSWALDCNPDAEGGGRWADGLPARPGSAAAWPYGVDVLYRGHPVEREIYALVYEAHGVVPWPTPRYPAGEMSAEAEPEAWEVTRWQRDLVVLLDSLIRPAREQSVDDYIGRCGISVVD